MTSPRIFAAALLGLTLPVLTACDAFKSFDEVQPAQEISPEQALDTVQGYEALVRSAYDYLQNQYYYGSNFVLGPDALADNIEAPQSTANRLIQLVRNEEGAHVFDDLGNLYGVVYSALNEVNLIIDGIDDVEIDGSPAAAQAQRDRLKGEAYFLRALYLSDLARGLGYEPGREVGGFDLAAVVRTSPTRTLEDAEPMPRSTNGPIYDQIISDYQQAADLLDGTARGGVQFASRPAALALLARAYLYAGDNGNAASTAQQAIDAASVSLVMDDGDDSNGSEILSSWLVRTAPPESIFSVQIEQGQDGNTTNGNNALQAITDPTALSISFDAVVTQDLLDAYDEDDARLALYTTGTSAQDETVTYIQKYTGTTALFVDWSPVIRLPELYYILAEARARQGDGDGARDALNVVRNARGLDDLDGSDGDALDAVLLERRLEFAFEGHRFFDLKRNGRDIPKPQTPAGVLPYSNYRVLAPIPFVEVETNPAITQNPGY